MSWDEIRAQLDQMAATCKYKPVDEVLKTAHSVPLIPIKPNEIRPKMSGKNIVASGSGRIWWGDRDEQ